MRQPFTALIDHFERDHSFEALRAQAARLQAMQRAIDDRWPAMRLTVLAVRDDSLVVQTPSPALAAKCRQVAPSLLEAVAGWAPGLSRVRVRAATGASLPAPPRPARPERAIGEQALETLQSMTSDLPAGPLRKALQRMIRRQLGE